MKKMLRYIVFCSFSVMISISSHGQCTGGTSAGTITPTTVWSSTGTTVVAGLTYYSFNATVGNIYYFSFCAADGGSSIYDTQITIQNNAGTPVGALGYSDDYCGTQSYVQWTATATATFRVQVTKYNCVAQAALGTMVYKYSAPLTCPSGLGTGVTNVASLPYSSGAGTTCGAVNDLNSLNTISCGGTNYLDGEDKVWVFTPTANGTITINLTSSGTYTGLVLYRGCPLSGQGGTCVDYAQSSTGNKTLTICVVSGSTYYLILDSWPSPACNAYSNLTISAPVLGSGCSTGTGTVNIAALPYTSTGRTTCGMGDDLTASNTISCGSTSYFGAEDEVFVFTPTASGTVTVNITSASSWVGATLYNGCPMVTSCSGTPGTCLAYAQSSDGSQSFCTNVTSGQTYYLVVDQFPSPYCIPSYNISISAPSGALAGITCANPVNISSLPYSATNESSSCFGNDYTNASTGSCGSLYESGEDKVYRYTSTGTECIGITLSGTSTNYIGYQVYSGCPGTGGTTCIGNNGGATSGTLAGSITLPSAGTYYIIVDTWAAPTSASYNISITSFGSGAANDLPCNAIPLTLGVYTLGNNNCSGGAGEPAVPSCWITPNSVNTVWYRVVATSTQLRVRTSPGTLTNSQIAVYTGTCGTGMTLVGCNDDAAACGTTLNYNSDLSLTVTNGQTYYIAVDGYSSATGSFGILAIDPTTQTLPLAYGQDCSVPNPVCNATISVGDPGWQAFGNYCDYPGGGTNCLLSGERGSAFYQINISAAGTLTFDIIPNDWPGAPSTAGTDYDFALWKIGGSGAVNCANIAAGSAPIRCNYSFLGVTGIYSTAGTSPPAYPGFGGAYDANLAVAGGDVYLLIVSNFSNSTSGFTMNFGSSPINYTPSSGSVSWTGGVGTSWSQPANWGGCAYPVCGIDAIVVPSSVNQPILTSNQTVKNLTISAGASLTINAGVTLTVCGNFTNYGSLIASPTGTILFNDPTAVHQITGSLTAGNRFPNLTITKNGGSVLLNNDIDIGGNLTMSNGTSIFNTNGKYIKLAGNFSNNNANTTLTNVTGTLEFNGIAAQSYTNTNGSLTLNNVLMNHTGTGVTLSGANSNMNIGTSGILTLTLGKIITGVSNEVYATNSSAAAVTTGNISSYVEGRLRRNISTSVAAYDFPVGNNATGYQRANINYTTAPTATYNLLAYFNSWGAVPNGPVSSECLTANYNSFPSFNHGYWTIDASVGSPTGTYTTSLYNRMYTNNTGMMWSVMKRSPSGSGAWALNGVCDATSTATQTKRMAMSGFSDFATVQFNSPLPVTLLEFAAHPQEEKVLCKWVTASEINNDYFIVQRSKNGIDFNDIGLVDGHGNSSTPLHYTFTDNSPYSGISYYRLKQFDFDGASDLSEIVAVEFVNGKAAFNLYPNPASDELSIDFSNEPSENFTAEIIDALGKRIMKYDFELNEYSFFKINIKSLAEGIYTLRITSASCCSGNRSFVVSKK